MIGITEFIGKNELILDLIRVCERRIRGGFWLMRFPDRKLFWSKGIYELFAIDDNDTEPSMDLMSRRVHPDDRRSAAEFEASISSAIPYDRDFRIITGSNSIKWVSSRNEFLIDPSGQAHCLISVLFDVTAEYETRQVISAHKQRFKALASSTATVVFTARADGYVEYFDGWEALTGQPDHLSLGWGWRDHIHPDDRERVVRSWREALAADSIHREECRVRGADGGYLWVLARATPVIDSSGKVVEWVGSAMDVQVRHEWLVDPEDSEDVSGAQLRAARGLLNWSVSRLSTEAAVPASAIRRLEEFDGVTKGAAAMLRALKTVLQAGGVEFIFPPNGKGGVRPS